MCALSSTFYHIPPDLSISYFHYSYTGTFSFHCLNFVQLYVCTLFIGPGTFYPIYLFIYLPIYLFLSVYWHENLFFIAQTLHNCMCALFLFNRAPFVPSLWIYLSLALIIMTREPLVFIA